jgi:3-hydroxy-3-methylglutaryl CoA synthase
MAGIISYGVHIPIYRLDRKILGEVWGRKGKGEKAVANYDEDSLTMGVDAGRECLKGVDQHNVDALYFASTTPPFKEKQSASIIAAALDLPENILCADFTNSLRSGTIALKFALDAVRGGSSKQVLVVASDCRIPPPNSASDPVFGDGAAAFLIGNEEVAVELTGDHHITSEFIDVWRLEYDKFTRTWEDRFIREQGYFPHLQKAIEALLKEHKRTLKDFDKIAVYAPNEGLHRAMGKKLGLDYSNNQVPDPLFNTVGNTGAAFAPMLLVGAIEEAKPGDKILLANYGDGADAQFFQVTDMVEKVGSRGCLQKELNAKLMLDNYGKYVKFKNLMEMEETSDYRQRTSLPQLWRDRQWGYRFHGHQCKECGKVQFPMQKFCIYCRAPEGVLEEIPLSGKKGTLLTFSLDERAPVLDPPNVLAAVSLEGGGRFFSQMTDRDPKGLKVGIPMELTFRRIHDALGIHNYFWKCLPARG